MLNLDSGVGDGKWGCDHGKCDTVTRSKEVILGVGQGGRGEHLPYMRVSSKLKGSLTPKEFKP